MYRPLRRSIVLGGHFMLIVLLVFIFGFIFFMKENAEELKKDGEMSNVRDKNKS